MITDLWNSKVQQDDCFFFFRLIIAFEFSLAYFLGATSLDWFGNCQKTALVHQNYQSSKTLRHRFNFEYVSVSFMQNGLLGTTEGFIQLLPLVAGLAAHLETVHYNAGLYFLPRKVRTGT